MSEIKKVKYERFLTADTHLKIQDGNRKLGKGIFSINLLAGSEPLTKKDGTQLTNIPGTCTGCCGDCESMCYAKRIQLFRNANIPTWADNTILATQDVDTFFKEVQQFIDRNMVAAIRYHSMGEIPSYEYLEKMVEIAKENPTIAFYTYTKRFNWIERYLVQHKEFPNNLVINMSIWHKNYDNPFNLPEFIYDDGTEEDVARLPHCPAVDKNGHETGMTCAKCKRCLRAKKGDKIAVYAH
jgi:ferredoxin